MDAAAPVAVVVFAPVYGSSPRIIQVPQAAQSAQASAADDDAVGAVDAEPAPPPMVRRIRPAPGH